MGDATDESLLCLSVLTLGEIRKGITSLPDAPRRVALETGSTTTSFFVADRILGLTKLSPIAGTACGEGTCQKSPLP